VNFRLQNLGFFMDFDKAFYRTFYNLLSAQKYWRFSGISHEQFAVIS
jgi:hypothetical protein